ncbi:MAG TPA: hypothetical protein DEV85_01285 [Vibrio sp.]|uniref:hypothetical protein n=1 Tax=Vibrio TaxID=662 RepID=UPI000EC5D29C|nr:MULTISPECIES: hypothetical protein [Vibrio]HCH00510.1 hypothetical protein [Vibrio sp.]
MVTAKTQTPKEKIEAATAEAIDSVKDQVEESLNEGSEKIKNKASQAENIIKEHPLLSVGCAFLAGWAISKIIK